MPTLGMTELLVVLAIVVVLRDEDSKPQTLSPGDHR